jgi:ABC-type Na+ transport system ATPase subunit NatA
MSAIGTHGLSKRYGDTVALDSLDLEVAEGEVYGYLGPNGAGKTTTIRLLLGQHRPSAGRAELFGIDAWGEPVRAHRRIAYVAGEPFLWPSLTSAETFELLARLHGGTDPAYRATLVDRFQLDTTKKIRALSKGNRQKVQLVAALATRADPLVLDEPTSGLDPLMEVAFRDCITEAKDRGQTGARRGARRRLLRAARPARRLARAPNAMTPGRGEPAAATSAGASVSSTSIASWPRRTSSGRPLAANTAIIGSLCGSTSAVSTPSPRRSASRTRQASSAGPRPRPCHSSATRNAISARPRPVPRYAAWATSAAPEPSAIATIAKSVRSSTSSNPRVARAGSGVPQNRARSDACDRPASISPSAGPSSRRARRIAMREPSRRSSANAHGV